MIRTLKQTILHARETGQENDRAEYIKIQKKLVKIDSYLESDASWSTALLKKLNVLDIRN